MEDNFSTDWGGGEGWFRGYGSGSNESDGQQQMKPHSLCPQFTSCGAAWSLKSDPGVGDPHCRSPRRMTAHNLRNPPAQSL